LATMTDDIRFLKGVGEKRALLFKKLGIDTVGALLRFAPRAYEDWSKITPLCEAKGLGDVCIRATVTSPVKEQYVRKNMTLYKFTAADSSGSMKVTLFNNKFDAQKINPGCEYLFYGKFKPDSFYFEMSSPKIRFVGDDYIRPLYSTCAGLTTNMIESAVRVALSSVCFKETLPISVIKRNALCSFEYAIRNIHFPKDRKALEKARERLIFEELFILQTGLLYIKNVNRGKTACIIDKDFTSEFITSLPFSMTGSQLKCVKECLEDISLDRPMNRLIQGDVGSGKTAVAAAVMYSVAKNGFQAALMVPTEVLAEQHFNTLKGFFEPFGLNVSLLTGSLTKKQKETVRSKLKDGSTDIIVGTHALISDNVEFNNLGLVITDEQHRFGTRQRAALSSKGKQPHVLVMSATPIPRTLALIMYGDLDISIIDEFPKGRQKIDSYLVSSDLRERYLKYLKNHIEQGRQGYIVCSLVEESETDSGLMSAEQYYLLLKDSFLKDCRIGLLHGKMKPIEKEKIMKSFSFGEIDILVATSVIEVGIDVPNAAIMIIENAERFGLSQLHQLRGRIGRGEHKSTCVFVSDAKGKTAERINILCRTLDGFKIADEDLKLRGPGDFLGDRQHGLPKLNIADIAADIEVLRLAGIEAKELLSKDPNLRSEENAPFKHEIDLLLSKMINN